MGWFRTVVDRAEIVSEPNRCHNTVHEVSLTHPSSKGEVCLTLSEYDHLVKPLEAAQKLNVFLKSYGNFERMSALVLNEN